ncbi:MAG: hypothetical protein CSA11_00290 [Chloroflexi bacterium]|nr:MAG: hypothetical protein CSB13_11490 [Chloroflexota bacterium]PIE82535.1 MAG: hypothetical protein CSA11_00290 [Chloroflexota bacterium]
MNFQTWFLLHRYLSDAVWIVMAIMSGWALLLAVRRKPTNAGFFACVIVGQVLVLLETVFGALLYFTPHVQPGDNMHFLYGGFLLLTLPLAHLYTRNKDDLSTAIVWMMAGFFMVGLTLRADATGLMGR